MRVRNKTHNNTKLNNNDSLESIVIFRVVVCVLDFVDVVVVCVFVIVLVQ